MVNKACSDQAARGNSAAGPILAEVMPDWVGWQKRFSPAHQEPDYAYPSTFPRILPFLRYNVSKLRQRAGCTRHTALPCTDQPTAGRHIGTQPLRQALPLPVCALQFEMKGA
jgi:hypothetical protein